MIECYSQGVIKRRKTGRSNSKRGRSLVNFIASGKPT